MNLIKGLYDQYLTESEKSQMSFEIYQKKISNILLSNYQISEQTAALDIISKLKGSKYQKVKLWESLKYENDSKNIEFDAIVLNCGDLTETTSKKGESIKIRHVFVSDGFVNHKITMWNLTAQQFGADKIGEKFTFQGSVSQRLWKGKSYHSISVSEYYAAPVTCKVYAYTTSILETQEKSAPRVIPRMYFKIVSVNLHSYTSRDKMTGLSTEKVMQSAIIEDLSGTINFTLWHYDTKPMLEVGAEYEAYSVTNKIEPLYNQLSSSHSKTNSLFMRRVPDDKKKIKVSISGLKLTSLVEAKAGLYSIQVKVEGVRDYQGDVSDSKDGKFRVLTFRDSDDAEGSFILNSAHPLYKSEFENKTVLLKYVIVSKYYEKYKISFRNFSLIQIIE